MPTGSVIGGVETWLTRVVAYLANHGWDPLVGLARGLRHNLPHVFQEMHPEMPSVVIDGRGMDQEGRIREVMQCIRRVQPKVIAPLGLHDAFWAACRWKQRGSQVRLVLRNQGLLPPLLADLCRFGPASDLVVCNSRLVAKFSVAQAAVAPERVWNIPNGADPIAAGSTVGRGQTAGISPLRLGYVGRFTRGDKRVLDMLPLCQRLRQREIPFTLDVVGEGPAGDELRRGLECEEYRDVVRFHGRLPHQQVLSRIYPNLDVLLLFSSSESFGIVLVEAMMHGVVPVTSQYTGFFTERLVVDGENGLSFPVGNTDAATDCLARLAHDRGLLSALADRGRERTTREYTWDRALDLWNQAFEWVLEQEPLPAENIQSADRSVSGTLDRWGIPPVLTHAIRRLRRQVLGPSVPAGGEEWPLFGRRYAAEELANLARICRELDHQTADLCTLDQPYAETATRFASNETPLSPLCRPPA